MKWPIRCHYAGRVSFFRCLGQASEPGFHRHESRAIQTNLFAHRSGEIDAPPIVVFEFATSRSGANARRFLQGYTGALVVDDFAGYKEILKTTPMRELGCWAHAWRTFFELHAANKSVMAAAALRRIAAIYDVEREAKDFDAVARQCYRARHAKPKVEALFKMAERAACKDER